LNSPFARNTRTHFARFVVIDDAIITAAIRSMHEGCRGAAPVRQGAKAHPTTPQSVDHLSCPYLLFADFMRRTRGDLKAHLPNFGDDGESVPILTYCVGFDVDVKGDAKSFFAYIKRCQIETTMPFNDYIIGSTHRRSRWFLPHC
jgi:hypothetical protein